MNHPAIQQSLLNSIHKAIRWLADVCDYAQSADRAGFNSVDTWIGHALANKVTDKDGLWSYQETLAAANLIVKYNKQLPPNIHIDVDAIKHVIAELSKASNSSKGKLKRRDIVKGEIYVADDQILIKAGYKDNLRISLRELIGAYWDDQGVVWRVDQNAENALALEEIAKEHGLILRKSSGWDTFKSVRYVRIDGNSLVVSGVNATRIREMIVDPNNEESRSAGASFQAIRYVDKTSFAIPLQSWNVQSALLWLISQAEESRLKWAVETCVGLLAPQRQALLKREQEHYTRAQALSISDEERQSLAATMPLPLADGLMPHQWVAVQALVENNQSILADQQGLGKTIEIIGAIEAAKAYPAIVLAPATALLNWRDEIAKWLPNRRIAVAGSRIAKGDQGVPFLQAEFIVLNYESFDKHQESLAICKPVTLVADEAQYLKGYNSARSKAVKSFCASTSVQRIIAATGTPVMNRPSELLAILTLLPDMLLEMGGFWFFAYRYCHAQYVQTSSFGNGYWDFSRSCNLGELANRLRETGRFVRRDKVSVLPALPPKQHERHVVEITNRDEYRLATEQFVEWLKTVIKPCRNRKRRITDEDESRLDMAAGYFGFDADSIRQIRLESEHDRSEAVRRMTALRQLVGQGKITAAIEYIRGVVKDEKLVVFAYHVEVQQALIDILIGDGEPVLSITGDMAAKARREAILKFQTDPSMRLIICSLKAAQTAITLTAAKRALMVELDWTPAALEQAEDRIHRIGQSGQVVISHLIALDTLDQRMSDILEQKRQVIHVLNSSDAPYGYRKDGVPRKQPAGPGRPALALDVRKQNRKATKAGWQARHSEYMRDYMRQRRQQARIKEAEAVIDTYQTIKRIGYYGMQAEISGGRYSQWYRETDYKRDLVEAYRNALVAQKKLLKLGIEAAIADPET